MIVIPALDLSGGKCVRLRQGDRAALTHYGADPVVFARQWQAAGAEWLHLVDLDGAIDGRSNNANVIREIVEALDIAVELGGGLRTPAQVAAALELGIGRVILGTLAAQAPETVRQLIEVHGPERIIVGVDARDGMVAIKGWTENTARPARSFLLAMQAIGVTRTIYTDIARDGMLTGPNVDAVCAALQATELQVIASGGVSTLDDLRALQAVGHPRLEGVIVGKALYERQFTYEAAAAIMSSGAARG